LINADARSCQQQEHEVAKAMENCDRMGNSAIFESTMHEVSLADSAHLVSRFRADLARIVA